MEDYMKPEEWFAICRQDPEMGLFLRRKDPMAKCNEFSNKYTNIYTVDLFPRQELSLSIHGDIDQKPKRQKIKITIDGGEGLENFD